MTKGWRDKSAARVARAGPRSRDSSLHLACPACQNKREAAKCAASRLEIPPEAGPGGGRPIRRWCGSAAAAFLHLLPEALHLRDPLLEAVTHDGLLIRRERRIDREPCIADLFAQCGIRSLHIVRNGGHRREIGLGLGKLGVHRSLDLAEIGAAGFARRLRLCDRVVPHRLLRRIEIELAFERRDGPREIAARTVAVMRGLRERNTACERYDGRGRDDHQPGVETGIHVCPDLSVSGYSIPLPRCSESGGLMALGPHCPRWFGAHLASIATGRCASGAALQ